MTTVGYARASRGRQNLIDQRRELTAAGCEPIHHDTTRRQPRAESRPPGLADLLAAVGEGDTVVVVELSRLGTSVARVVQALDAVRQAGAVVRSLSEDEHIDSSKTSAPAFRSILKALGSYEEAPTPRGGPQPAKRPRGRPPVLTPEKKQEIYAKQGATPGLSLPELAAACGVSLSSVKRALKEQRDKLGPRGTSGTGPKHS